MLTNSRIVFTIAHIAICLPILSFAAAPPLRDEVNLAGTWTGGTVPRYTSGNGFTGTRTYERTVMVPSGWTGKKIFLELEAVAWGDVTSINGTQVGSSTGGWLPHSYDITARVTPGQNATITVVANGNKPSGSWPTGYPNYDFSGQFYDAYLRAYGTVAIRDVDIVTSVTNKTITAKYSVQNFGTTGKTITVNADAVPSTGGASAVSLASASTTIAAGATSTIQATASWPNPNLWWPTDPKLYLLCSAVKESGTTLDSQTVRFGFREVTIAGRHIKLNGVRLNQRGTSYEMGRSTLSSPTAMATYIAQAQATNSNSARFHAKPQANALLDVCDEMGYCVESEAPLWQAAGECVASNTKNIWFPAFVKNQRNHASIITWSAENECYGLGDADAVFMVNNIHTCDGNNRPVWHEDVQYNDLPTATKHYPEGYLNAGSPGLVYSTNWIDQTKPVNSGEWCTSYDVNGAVNKYWHGTWARGMRYNDVSVIHGYTEDWAYTTASSAEKTNLTNSHNPVALFDKDYDGLGVGPIQSNSYPSIAAGSTANRTLVLYNDEFADQIITVNVAIKSGSTTYATVTKSYQVVLGNHVEFSCSFQVPYVGGSNMDMVLTTSKGGAVKFTEDRYFTVTGVSSGTSSSTITLGGGGIDPTIPYMQISPAGVAVNGATGTDAAPQTIAVTNAGGGTLGTVTAHVTCGPGATGWVTATPGGFANARSIALQFTTSAISGGNFTAQLIVKSAGALPDSIICPINLNQTGPDLTPPTIVRASGTGSSVVIAFSEEIESLAATNKANYSINNGVTINSVTFGADAASVTLNTSPLTNGTTYTVTVNNIKDRSANANTIAANTTVSFTAARTITKIRFYPRAGMAARMAGCRFEGTQGNATTGTYSPIYSISGTPADGQWTEVTNLQNTNLGFSAARFYSPSGFGNVAEVEFYSGDVKLTGTAFGTSGSYAGSGNTFAKVFDGDVATFFDCDVAEAFAGLVFNFGATVSPRGIAAGASSSNRLSIVLGRSMMSIPLSSREPVTVSIFNLHGGLVSSVPVSAGKNGTLMAQLDGARIALAKGHYIMQVKAGNIAAAKRFGILR